jgi:hypothetical protein
MAHHTLTFDDEIVFDEPPQSDARPDGDSEDDGSLECILMSMCHDDVYQQKRRVKNRECAQQSREADREYIHLLLAELNDILTTFEMYVTYTELLKLHGACAAEGTHCSNQCYLTRKAKITHVRNNGIDKSPEKTLASSMKERNRLHAQNSRRRRDRFLLDVIKERDVSLSTLADVSVHTAALETSCVVLNDFNDSGDAFMELTEMRQALLHRTHTHTENQRRLKSRLAYRVSYRVHFKQNTH